MRETIKHWLTNHNLLMPLKKARTRYWDALDVLFFRAPRWRKYIQLNNEPYSATYESSYKRKKIEDGVEKFLFFLPKGKPMRLLDLGAGNGYALEVIKKKLSGNCEVLGLCINRQERRDARKRGLTLFRGDMHAMPFLDEHFDAIFCKDTFEHSIAPYILLSEINRVLKFQGHAVIILPNRPQQLKATYHFSVLTSWQMEILCYKTGLRVVRQDIYTGPDDTLSDVYLVEKTDSHNPKYPKAYAGVADE